MTAEDDRAAAFRAQQIARVRNKRVLEKALAGDADSKVALEAKTEALLAYDENGVPRVGVRR